MELETPTDPWYVEELAAHKRRVRKASSVAKDAYTPTKGRTMTDQPETLAERVDSIVHEYAYRDVSKRYGKPGERGITIEKCRAEAWQTPLGRDLYALRRSHGPEPVSKALGEIKKDAGDQYQAALEVIRKNEWPS